jgi:hypothetical protein
MFLLLYVPYRAIAKCGALTDGGNDPVAKANFSRDVEKNSSTINQSNICPNIVRGQLLWFARFDLLLLTRIGGSDDLRWQRADTRT